MTAARHHRWAATAAAALLLTACSGGGSDGQDATPSTAAATAETTTTAPTTTTTTFPPAETPGRGPAGEWELATPADSGMDAAVLEGARAYAFAEGRNTQSVVVVRHGKIVAEWYAPGAGPDSWVASWSVAKSFTSAAVGIAIEEGLIPSVDEPMTTWYPEWKGSPRERMTLRHVLNMESGLDWNESYTPSEAGESDVIQQVVGEGDQLDYAVGQPPRDEPGTTFSYSSGDTMLLSGVLEQATGRSAGDYAREKLLEPIGIDDADWWSDTSGNTLTYCCFDATSRDFARFGQLYLDGGAWGDRQVVPAGWVADSLTPSEASDGDYGYQWWLGQGEGIPEDMFSARGHDGQYIIVIPSLDLVVVRNGTYGKADAPPVADPNLFTHYPPQNLVPGKGTMPPDEWDNTDLLRPIVASVLD